MICESCKGSGKVANDGQQTPWPDIEALPYEAQDARGFVPQNCAACKGSGRVPMHIAELGKRLGIDVDALRKAVYVLTRDRECYEELMRRVHLEQTCGRAVTDEGHSVKSPPPLKIKLLAPWAGRKQGAVYEVSYDEGVELVNTGVAVFPDA